MVIPETPVYVHWQINYYSSIYNTRYVFWRNEM